jgi:Lysyl oxidase
MIGDVVRRGPAALVMLALAALTLGPGAGAAHAAPSSKALLPDLAVLAPFDVRIENVNGKRRLRFATVVVNIGVGPFQLKGFDPKDGHAAHGDTLSVRQQVKEPDGSLSRHDSAATMFWSGDGHNHWHVSGIQEIRLQNLDDEVIGRVAKTGFCFLDSYVYGSVKPSRYDSGHSVCQTRSDGTVPMGISVMWGDIYPSTIAFQWIDITGLPSGTYRLKVIADPPTAPGGTFLESDETNNKGWTKIRLTSTGVTVLKKSPKP